MDFLDFQASGRRWRAHLAERFDLAIAMEFDGPQPRFFAEGPATAEPLRFGAFAGSVELGASCNCLTHTVAPHCHGTHTECVGHVTTERRTVAGLPASPAAALLLTVAPTRLDASRETGPRAATPADTVVTRHALEAAAARQPDVRFPALVLRTLPNDPDKRWRRYEGGCPAPYFTREAMDWIVARDVDSIVVDLPSLDRADDGGELLAHRLFWGLPAGSRRASEARRGSALVTELAYVPGTAEDGCYLLDLQVPAFASDAAPSRPILFRATEVSA